MAITLGNKTKLTSEVEKLFIEAGGGDPDATFTRDALKDALVNTINVLAERNSPILLKIYKQYEKDGAVPPLSALEDDESR